MNNLWERLKKGQPNNPGSITELIKTGSMRMPLARSFETGRYSVSCQRSDVKLNIMILYFPEIHLFADKSATVKSTCPPKKCPESDKSGIGIPCTPLPRIIEAFRKRWIRSES